jgi:lipopolysaccharide transport system ATP-binding protein
MEPAISVERLSKAYRLGAGHGAPYRTLRDTFAGALSGCVRRWRAPRGSASRRSPATLWALKDVSFGIEAGDVVGIIGPNGAGKSTLLKILSRITEPSAGRATLRGRVGSLLEVGTGFHPELTGRENIYLNGAIVGMSRQQIRRQFDQIVAFAEVESFLDTPVKRYSSGMFVRLAFAVAAHLEPDILLVDEVLAVGDAAFQTKCLGKMGEVGRSGRTVLLVSHNMASVLNLCRRVVFITGGRLAFQGPCEEGIRRYLNSFKMADGADIDLAAHPNRRAGCTPILARIRLLNCAGEPAREFLSGDPMSVEVSILEGCSLPEVHCAVGYEDPLGGRLFTLATYLTDLPPGALRGARRLVCRLAQVPLIPGRYSLTLNAGPQRAAWTDMIDHAVCFDVLPADVYGNGRLPHPHWGRFVVRSRWESVNG